MRKFNKIIILVIDEKVRHMLHKALNVLLAPSVVTMVEDKETMAMASILIDVEKKLNKNLEQQRRKSHKFKFKYHEANALMEFMGLMDGVFDCTWTMAVMKELIGNIDKQMA